jgi:hypothetical protein
MRSIIDGINMQYWGGSAKNNFEIQQLYIYIYIYIFMMKSSHAFFVEEIQII